MCTDKELGCTKTYAASSSDKLYVRKQRRTYAEALGRLDNCIFSHQNLVINRKPREVSVTGTVPGFHAYSTTQTGCGYCASSTAATPGVAEDGATHRHVGIVQLQLLS